MCYNKVMDNEQMSFGGMPPVQSMQPAGMPQSGTPVQPMMSSQGGMPPVQSIQPAGPSQSGLPAGGMPMIQQVQLKPEVHKDYSGLIKTIAIIVLSLVAVTFIGLFIWMTGEYNVLRASRDDEIAEEVAKAKDEVTTKMNAERVELEKYPYKTFVGPVDYGQLSFEYPKTWSVYVGADAISGGDFKAYLNPIQVDAVSDDTINALRVTIRDKSFDEVTAEYEKEMNRRDSGLSIAATTIGQKGIPANRYTGKIPKTDLSGFIVTFKIRDKTAVLQTDSVLFQEEFDKLLGTIVFNE